MGIGFVLLIWAALLTCVGTTLVAGLWIWRRIKQRHQGRGNFRIGRTLVLFFVLLMYGGVSFIIYGIWCETVRHVDAGIGDSWEVPVGNGYFFCMIDVTESGYLMQGGCSGEPLIDNITNLAADGDRIVGITGSNGAFVFDTQSRAVRTFPDIGKALGQFSPQPAIQAANSFYIERRWGWLDLEAIGCIGIVGTGILFFGYRFYLVPARP